jgi:transcriptional regulator with XRE-family HTH domain
MDIQSAISRHGTTKAELARKMDVAPSYITQLVSGQSSPSMKMLDKLAELIGCKRWEFFLDEIKSDPHGVERFIDEMDPAEVMAKLGVSPAALQPAAPQPQEKTEAGEKKDELPFLRPDGSKRPEAERSGGQQQEQASEKATSEQVLRFSYDCPHCGHEVRITIE